MAEFVEIYRDESFIIEMDESKETRYRPTNPSISGSDRIDGLPSEYYLEGTQVRKKPYHGIKKPPEAKASLHNDVAYNALKEQPEDTALTELITSEVTFIDTNPKTAFGAVKPGTYTTPPMPLYEYSLAHYQGALKYGHYNWREDPVSISTYINAARRHIDLYVEGQRDASDTGIHNLAHAMTCLSIVIDAEWYGSLIDDRSTMGDAVKLEEYFESKKELQLKIQKDWTGHAQKLKDKLNARKDDAKA